MPEQRVKPDIKFAKQVLQDVEAKKLDKKLVKHFPYTRDGVLFLDAVKGIANQDKEAVAVLTGQPGKTLKVNLAFKKTDLEDTSTFDQEILCTQYTQGKGFGTIVMPIPKPIPEPPRQDEDQVKPPPPVESTTTAKALSDLNKLVACERRGDIESLLKKDKPWITIVSEFASIPPMVAETIIDMDESADELDTLITVLNVLRKRKITTGKRGGKVKDAHESIPEPVKELLKFLLARATEEFHIEHQESFTFEQPSFPAEDQYVELLSYEPCEKVEYDEDASLAEDITEVEKSRAVQRAASREAQEETGGSEAHSRLVLANAIQSLSTHIQVKPEGKGAKGYDTAPEDTKKQILNLASKDYNVPAKEAPNNLVAASKFSSASALVEHIRQSISTTDMDPNKAMAENIRKLRLVGAFLEDSKGITIFGCAPKSTDQYQTDYEHDVHQTTMDLADQGVKGVALTHKDILELSRVNIHIPSTVDETKTMIKSFVELQDWLWGMVETPRFITDLKKLLVLVEKNSALIRQEFNLHGQLFLYSLLVRIHGKIVRLIQKARISVDEMKRVGLNFDNLFDALEDRTFMNLFKSSLPINDKGNSRVKQSTTHQYNGNSSRHNDAGRYNRGNTNRTNGNTNQYNADSKGRTEERGQTRFRQGNQQYNDDNTTKWTEKLGPYMKPNNRTRVISLGINLPMVNGSECCMAFHAKGECYDQCARANSHVQLNGQQKKQYFKYCDELRKSK